MSKINITHYTNKETVLLMDILIGLNFVLAEASNRFQNYIFIGMFELTALKFAGNEVQHSHVYLEYI